MMKVLVVLIGFLSFALAGCSMIPLTVAQVDHYEQEQFIKALDQFVANNRIDQLQQVQKDYPDSAWGKRAETIVLYAQELDNRKDQLAAAREENKQLQEKLDQLKNVLIRTESCPK